MLDAAEGLIVEKGMESTSITDVAKRAGSSVGSVYHHFKDKRALFYALFHRMTQVMSDQTRQAADPARWEGATARDLLEGFLELRLRQRRLASLSKPATALVMADDPELKSHMAEIKLEECEALFELLLTRKAQIGHPDPEFAASFVIDQVNAMLYALSDPYQKASALAGFDDETFKEEVNMLFAFGIVKFAKQKCTLQQRMYCLSTLDPWVLRLRCNCHEEPVFRQPGSIKCEHLQHNIHAARAGSMKTRFTEWAPSCQRLRDAYKRFGQAGDASAKLGARVLRR